MDNIHEPKSYGQQWREDFTWKGFRENSVGPIVPSFADLKDQGKVVYNVLIKSPYHIYKFCATSHH
ncbi:MAG: hypothetical protein K0Q49_2023 [Haloplasmataceae bacterium]|jgi:hypothetical protein|nr:hypothetical protein [Haloplasmataceae bacterium]